MQPKNNTWNLAEWGWTCKKSDHDFYAFGSAGDWMPYGYFYMYARNGDIALWEAVTDLIFTECRDITHTLLPSNLSDDQKRKVFWSIQGICCDRAADGSLYQSSPYCPFCEDSPSKGNGPMSPRNVQTMDLPPMTHNHWESLTLEQKQQLVLAELKRRELI